jgi:hypothetical protein
MMVLAGNLFELPNKDDCDVEAELLLLLEEYMDPRMDGVLDCACLAGVEL